MINLAGTLGELGQSTEEDLEKTWKNIDTGKIAFKMYIRTRKLTPRRFPKLYGHIARAQPSLKYIAADADFATTIPLARTSTPVPEQIFDPIQNNSFLPEQGPPFRQNSLS